MTPRLVANLIGTARAVRVATGKSIYAQLREIIAAKSSNPTLGAHDYYAYRMYDDAVRTESKPRDFLGWRAEADLAHALNKRNAVLPGWDKYTFQLLATDRGLPVPGIEALYLPGASSSALARVTAATHADVCAFLRSNRTWPLFAKPSYSQKGFGAAVLAEFRAASDSLVYLNGETIRVDQFASNVTNPPPRQYVIPDMGYLFQEVLRPHEEIARATGCSAVSGVRIVLVRLGDRVELVKALWKIVCGSNYVDNFHGGAMGNLIAEVDLRTGVVGRAIDGRWPNARFVDIVEATGCRIPGFALPCWADVRELCQKASMIAPMMRIQHWDVAISDRGPVLLELNDHGSIGWLQALGPGLLRTGVREALATYGDAGRYRWIRRIATTSETKVGFR